MYLLRSNSMDSNQRIDINAELSSEAMDAPHGIGSML
jgi:hypothetical protein